MKELGELFAANNLFDKFSLPFCFWITCKKALIFKNAIVAPSKSFKQGSSSLLSDCKIFYMLLRSRYESFLFLQSTIYLLTLVSYAIPSLDEY